MFRVLGFRRQEKEVSEEETIAAVLREALDFELALKSMDYLLDDRTEEGEYLISDDADCTIKVMAGGVIGFLEATLGFEPEVIKKAGEILTRAEALSNRDKLKHQKSKLKTSSHFPPGTEYAVTYAEANLLNALIMLLSESMIESAKALLKLRKAYYMLEEILKLIHEYENKSISSNTSSTSLSTAASFVDIPSQFHHHELSDKDLKIAVKVKEMRRARKRGEHIGNAPAAERLKSDVGFNKEGEDKDQDSALNIDTEVDENRSTIDEFIITGANLCFGLIQLVLSLLPTGITKVLSVVGIKGSKEEGLNMIWKAVEGRNIHGCIGLLGLLVFYDGPFQFTDVDFDVPAMNNDNLTLQKTISGKKMSKEIDAFSGTGSPTLTHPGKRLTDALLITRAIFPNSALWLLQEARMLSSRGRLEESLELMNSINRKIEMKQVEALLGFDKVNVLVFLHRYEEAAIEVLRLLDISKWSPGFYTYIAAICYVEQYRMCKLGIAKPQDIKRMDHFKEQARINLVEAPIRTEQKKMLSKQMPFDKFVMRKYAQFETCAKENKVDLIDAIGTSPIHELVYFWNGYNRMPQDHLKISLSLLNYSNSKQALVPEVQSQSMIRNLLESITYRRLGEFTKGCKLIDDNVLKYIISFENTGKLPYRFIKHTEDPWLYPVAMYERALFTWKQQGLEGLEEAKEWLKRANAYADDYELSTRVSMKTKAALDRLEGL